MLATPIIRLAIRSDYESLADVMFDAVRNGQSAYTKEQCKAWVPEVRRGAEWSERLSVQSVFIADYPEQIAGFISLAARGYIDLVFIRPKFQKSGLFRLLYNELEDSARKLEEPRLWVHASLMAQPAFSAVGFEILDEQAVEIGNQRLRRFEMQKRLASYQ